MGGKEAVEVGFCVLGSIQDGRCVTRMNRNIMRSRAKTAGDVIGNVSVRTSMSKFLRDRGAKSVAQLFACPQY
jgi:hypothetical protein